MKNNKFYFVISLFLLGCLPFLAVSQDVDKGIHFVGSLSWQQIQEKAKIENKFIFVDCYATWCAPCKMMDKNTYPNDTVGAYMNERFISVKFQIDSTKQDAQDIKDRYASAHQIKVDYKIEALPTFLFFSPKGNLLHKGEGYLPPSNFIKLVQDALNPATSYYSLIDQYKTGKLPLEKMPDLVTSAQKNGNRKLASEIGRNYLLNYLAKLDDQQLFTRANFAFMSTVIDMVKSSDKIFQWYLKKGSQVDTLLSKPGYSFSVVNYVITKEVIVPKIDEAKATNTSPDWENLKAIVKGKFGKQYVDRNILQSKVSFYFYKKDWQNYTKYLVQKCEMDTILKMPKSFIGGNVLNDNAWNIFCYSNNRQELLKALSWSKRATEIYREISPKNVTIFQLLDTEANLLYKLGKKEEALALETRAISLIHTDERFKDFLPEYNERAEKIKKGLITWVWPEK